MFIAMNRFRVAKGSDADFEQAWLSRDSHLDKVPGFVEFHLPKGPEAEDHTLYPSHTVWENRAVFEAWTKSERSGQRIVGQGPSSAPPHGRPVAGPAIGRLRQSVIRSCRFFAT
jgi:heme-degrading monooxygenase HmoA